VSLYDVISTASLHCPPAAYIADFSTCRPTWPDSFPKPPLLDDDTMLLLPCRQLLLVITRRVVTKTVPPNGIYCTPPSNRLRLGFFHLFFLCLFRLPFYVYFDYGSMFLSTMVLCFFRQWFYVSFDYGSMFLSTMVLCFFRLWFYVSFKMYEIRSIRT
jgi:hypothetical protein